MNKTFFLFSASLTVALIGCAAPAIQSRPTCELRLTEICSRAAEAKLQDSTLVVDYSPQPGEAPPVVPLVVPLLRPDGGLAAEVDCYTETDSHTYSIIQSNVAIPPESQESLDFLKSRHLCADAGSFAQAEHPLVVTALARQQPAQ